MTTVTWGAPGRLEPRLACGEREHANGVLAGSANMAEQIIGLVGMFAAMEPAIISRADIPGHQPSCLASMHAVGAAGRRVGRDVLRQAKGIVRKQGIEPSVVETLAEVAACRYEHAFLASGDGFSASITAPRRRTTIFRKLRQAAGECVEAILSFGDDHR